MQGRWGPYPQYMCRSSQSALPLLLSLFRTCIGQDSNGYIRDDEGVWLVVWVFLAAFGVVLCCVVTAVLYRKHLEMKQDQIEEHEAINGVQETREWYFLEGAVQRGPYTRYQMNVYLKLGEQGGFTRRAMVKLHWQENWTTVEALWPEPGTEFTEHVAPRFSVEDVRGDWHRHSLAARPLGDAPLPPMDWYYQKGGRVQGPWQTGQMRVWFMQGYFDAQTLVRVGDGTGDFVPVADLFPQLESSFAVEPTKASRGFGSIRPMGSVRIEGSIICGTGQTPGRGSAILGAPAPIGRTASCIANAEMLLQAAEAAAGRPSTLHAAPVIPCGRLPDPPMLESYGQLVGEDAGDTSKEKKHKKKSSKHDQDEVKKKKKKKKEMKSSEEPRCSLGEV